MSLKQSWGPGVERRPFWQNVYDTHSEWGVFFCKTDIYTKDRGLGHIRPNILCSKPWEFTLGLIYKTGWNDWPIRITDHHFQNGVLQNSRTLFLQNINNITSNYHLLIRISMCQAQHQVFYTQLFHLISIITSITSIPTFKEVRA